ncbi:MAG: hypothetical protein RSC92_03820, partial [Clostridia bacterium]
FNSLDQSVSTINGTLSKHNASIEALVKDVSAVNNAFIFKGSITAATSTTIKALNGYAYVASEKFTLATSKVTLEVGDMMIVTANLSAETALSALSSDQFVVLERNLNGAVITDGTAATDDDKIAILSGNTVKAHASETVKSLKAYSDTKALDASTWASTKIGDVGTGTVKAYIDSADGALDASIKASIVRLTAIEAKNLIQDTSIGNLNTSVSNLSGTITELESTHLRYITALAASLTWKG